jgi:alkaline phosphatase
MHTPRLALATTLALALGTPAPAQDWQAEGRRAVERARALDRDPGLARNLILFVGDGMGLTTVTAARILEGQLRGEPGEENLLAFERLPHLALAKTYNTNQQVPDSAGTMTAMLTGSKTRAGMISVDETVARGDFEAAARHPLRTLFEEAERRGLATGVVSTARLTHATPAACYAHSPERNWEDDADLPDPARAAGFADIARQLVEFPAGDGLEIALGGGRASFLPEDTADPEYPGQRGARRDGRNLTREWVARREGAQYVWNRAQLESLDPGDTTAVLGLFEPSHMRFEVDRGADPAGEPSLAELSAFALDRLARGRRGYVLMVEAGRIDHGHHASSAHRALHDTIALSDAVSAALARVDLQETLVVVTADHGHVLTVAGYPTRGNPILGLVRGNDARGEPAAEPARDGLGRPYTTLGYANGPGHPAASSEQPAGPKRFSHFPRGWENAPVQRPDLSEVDTTAPDYLQESAVPLRTETHSGEDVPIYAGGPGASLFHGVQEQTYVYHAAVAALGWDRDSGWLTRTWRRLRER